MSNLGYYGAMPKGQVYKIHSDFYYVKLDSGLIECRLREVLKKQKIDVYVGDFVETEDNSIIRVCERRNLIKRPGVSNLDLLVVVSSIKEPALDFIQLNRYLTFAKIYNIDAILCFNKEDLSDDEMLEDEITSIYKPLGYKIFITSALNKTGLDKLKEEIEGKTVVLCGQSGVGKSSILSAIHPELNFRVGEVSKKMKRGVHTTRHVEIIEFDDFRIVDTPGFSNLKFDFILPSQLGEYFDEIKEYKKFCKFSDCLHRVGEGDCGVIENLDKINISRYESYLQFLDETLSYKKEIRKRGLKKEDFHKKSHGKTFAKISTRKRESSRNTTKQRIRDEEI